MTKKGKKSGKHHLAMPNYILNIREIGKGEKMLLAHIYSFGCKGCWQSNKTLGNMFFRRPRTITLWVSNLKRAGLILWLHPKGYYRTLWAKAHPDIEEAQSLPYRGKEISKTAVISGQTKSTLLSNNLLCGLVKNCEVTSQKNVFPLSKKLLHTNNTTKKETMENTATPSPLPAKGQAPALLQDRKEDYQAKVKQFEHTFGSGKPRVIELTPEQFEQQKQQQIKVLLACEKSKKYKIYY